jgi:hypothetical protein
MTLRMVRRGLGILTLALAATLPATAQLRVATWNVTFYNGGRVADIQTSVYGEYAGRAFAPDVILAQEFLNSTAMLTFKNALNTAPGSPGDWDGRYVGGPDTNNALFFRTSKVQFIFSTIVSYGGAYPDGPRHVVRWMVRPQGYSSSAALLACYSSHMKAGSSSDDRTRRLTEAQNIADDALDLNPAFHFLLGADLNIQTSSEAAYVELIGGGSGPFHDPISTPGSWNNNCNYRYVHSQDPSGAGGMDDRYDQILVSANLLDGGGFEYIGTPGLPFSTSTWDDPNHSYRTWGNDGTSCNQTLRTTGNTMVGPTIAQALKNVATTAGGHLPVYVDLRVPAEIDATEAIDFGEVEQGSSPTRTLRVWNAGDYGLWGYAGVADLVYTLDASAGFGAPAGQFTVVPGDQENQHTVTMDTASLGTLSGTITIASNAPDEPSRAVLVSGTVVAAALLGDLNCDGFVTAADIDPFVLLLTSGIGDYQGAFPDCNYLHGDCNEDGVVSAADIDPFVQILTGGVAR